METANPAPKTMPIDALAFPGATKDYLKTMLDPIMMEMMSAVTEDLPDKPLEYVVAWLRKRGGVVGNPCGSLREQNAALKEQLINARAAVGEIIHAVVDDNKSEDKDKNESEEEESGEEDEAAIAAAEAEALRIKAAQKGPRQSVSAEAYGEWNVKKDIKAPEFPKSDEQRARLLKTLNRSFLFNALPAKDLDIIVKAMQEKVFSAGERIITEGEDGDVLFVIEDGSPECKKLVDGAQKVVKTCVPGDVFGELALLYNCPRAATVETSERCICWQLDRETFNSVVREAAIKRSAEYDKFLQDVPLLKDLESHERSVLVDALKCDSYSKGDFVKKQGEPGTRFYFVEEGELEARKQKLDSEEQRKVDSYSRGMYFGEFELLKNQPQRASVVVMSESAKVVSIDRRCFMNLVGSVGDILQRRIEGYQSESSSRPGSKDRVSGRPGSKEQVSNTQP